METQILNIAFLILGCIFALIYYLDCWKPEKRKTDPKNLLKFRGLLLISSGSLISGLAKSFDNHLIENNAFLFYIIGLAFSLIIYILIFPLLTSFCKNSNHKLALLILDFIKALTQGVNKSLKEIEQSQVDELRRAIKRKDFLASECHALLDGLLSHLYTVAEEDEQRSELSFQLLLDKNLALILSTLFEKRGELNRYRAAVFYHDDKESLNLEYFTGVSRSDQDDYSREPLSIEGSIGGKAYSEKRIIIFPRENRPFQSRSQKYKSFMVIPIGINDDIEGILTIDCIDKDHRFNDPSIHQFLNVLGSVLHLAGSIYRVE